MNYITISKDDVMRDVKRPEVSILNSSNVFM